MNRNLATLAAAVAFAAAVNGESVLATADPIAVDSCGSALMRWAERFESPADSEAHRADFARFKEECAIGAFVIGQASSMENIRPRAGFWWRKADEVKVRLARGERESVQILVAPNGSDLKGVQVAVEMGSGFAATNVAASVVGYVLTTNVPPYNVRPEGKPPALGWWPDPILDFQRSCDICGDDVQSFWVRVSCPRGQAAGTYKGSLAVSAEGVETVRIPLAVRVNDFEVGTESPIPLSVSSLVPGGYGKRLASDPGSYVNAWKTHEREYSDFFADYFITRHSIYGGEPLWDSLLRLKAENRLGMFSLAHIGNRLINPRYRDKTLQEIRAKYEKAKELGILDKAFFYGFDEANPPAHTNAQMAAEILHREFPCVPVMTTARDKLLGTGDSVLKDFDIHCPPVCFWGERPVREAKEAGRKVWWYFSNIPAYPWANCMVEAPPAELRSLMGAQTMKFKPDGFLYYQTMKWTSAKPIAQGPYTEWNPCSLGPYHGDGQWTCCGPDMLPLATIRLENFRDGLEDLWYARTLEELYARRMAEKIREDELVLSQGGETAPDDWCERARKVLAVPDEVVRSTATFSVDPDVIYRWRDEMADLIEAAVK